MPPAWLRMPHLGKGLRHRVSAVIARSSRVGDGPLYEPASFPAAPSASA